MPKPISRKTEPTNGNNVKEVYNIVDDLLSLAWPIEDLVFDPMNARLHPERNMESIIASIQKYGQRTPLVVNKRTRHVEKGNGTLKALKTLGWTKAAVVWVDDNETDAIGYGLADNRTAELAEWHADTVAKLEMILKEAEETPIGWSQEELAKLRDASLELVSGEAKEAAAKTLAERFIVPPFTVLDARQGYWQTRKKAWIALGISSELGRGDVMPSGAGSCYSGSSERSGYRGPTRSPYANAIPGGSRLPSSKMTKDGKIQRGGVAGRPLAKTFNCVGPATMKASFADGDKTGARNLYGAYDNKTDDTSLKIQQVQDESGTSIFDPVLCELVYRWFCPPKGLILDPFAGGSVRGIVASRLGRKYCGIDLRQEQVEANEKLALEIVPDNPPKWVTGDAVDVATLLPSKYDMVFSCPPYFNLEVYSDDPRDLSTMEYSRFLELYRKIIQNCVSMLKPNRFACFVVGDVRDNKGMYRNLVGETVVAFQDAGASLYNNAILVTMVGSLPLRVGAQFTISRKLGSTHQHVLVFCKGDPKLATQAIGEVEVGDVTKAFANSETGE